MSNLLISITSSPLQGIVGRKLVYTATVTNQENHAVMMAWLADGIPSEFAYLSAPSCSKLTDDVYCDFDFYELESGQSLTRTITYIPLKAGTVANKFEVVSFTSLYVPETIEKTVTTQILPLSTSWVTINLKNAVYWIPAFGHNSSLKQYIGYNMTWYLSGGTVIEGMLTSINNSIAQLKNVKVYSIGNHL